MIGDEGPSGPPQAEGGAPSSDSPTGNTRSRQSDSSGGERPVTTTLRERALALPERQVTVAGLISMGALVLGSIGPWATATVLGITVSASGLHGGGWVTLITALVGLIVLLDPQAAARTGWLYQHRWGIWRALLWISLVVCILNFGQVETYGLAGVVNPGWGLYLSLIAVLASLAVVWVRKVQKKP